MVPKTGSDEDDQYDEYMVLDGAVEHVPLFLTAVITLGSPPSATKVSTRPDSPSDPEEGPDNTATDKEVEDILNDVFGKSSSEPVLGTM